MKRIILLSFLGLFFVTAWTSAQEAADPLRHLAPYLEEDSLFLGWVDVRNFDLEQIYARLRKLGLNKAELDSTLADNQKIKDRLLEAGVKHVYFTNVGSPLQFDLLFVVPGTNPQAVMAAIPNERGMKAQIAGSIVLVGFPRSLEKAATRKGKVNPEWAKVLAKLEAFPSQAVFLPPRALLRAYVELQPELPKELGGGPTAPVVEAFQWVSLGFDIAKLNAQLIVQTKDEAAAKLLDPLLDRVLALAKKSPEAHEMPGVAILLQNHRPKRVGDQFRLALDAKTIDSAFLPLALRTGKAAKLSQTMNNLKQIGLAMHNYHDVNKTFPPQGNAGKDKTPLLSWRVHILPYIEQQSLYNEFRLNEPWDSDHNKTLIAKMPIFYLSPLSKMTREDGKTTYVVPSGPTVFFSGIQKKHMRSITDGTSNTIMAIDVDDSKAVIWTKPEDYPVEQKKPNTGGLFRPGVDRIIAAFFDGSVHSLPMRTPDEILWLYFCPNDGQVIPEQK